MCVLWSLTALNKLVYDHSFSNSVDLHPSIQAEEMAHNSPQLDRIHEVVNRPRVLTTIIREQ